MNLQNANDTGKRLAYVLGHSDRELERLSAQARLLNPITRQFFHNAGIAAGMRVLDIGSGAGDVAFLVADLVGSTGEVLGVDTSPTAVAAAQARTEAQSLNNVSFRQGDASQMTFERPFDAVVGRYVLQFNRNAGAVLKNLAGHLAPGGVIVFHELDWDGAKSFPPSPTYDRCCHWFVETLRLSGTETRMGIKLHSAFVAAELPAPELQLEAIICGGVGSSDYVHAFTELLNTVLPVMERLGVATAAEVGIETLAERIHDEVIASNSVIVGRSEIGAWTRI